MHTLHILLHITYKLQTINRICVNKRRKWKIRKEAWKVNTRYHTHTHTLEKGKMWRKCPKKKYNSIYNNRVSSFQKKNKSNQMKTTLTSEISVFNLLLAKLKEFISIYRLHTCNEFIEEHISGIFYSLSVKKENQYQFSNGISSSNLHFGFYSNSALRTTYKISSHR